MKQTQEIANQLTEMERGELGKEQPNSLQFPRPTDLIHIKVEFEDTFSGAKLTRTVTRSYTTFWKMQKSLGAIVPRFENNIRWNWKVISVTQL